MEFVFESGERRTTVQIERRGGGFEVRVDGRIHTVEARPGDDGCLDLVVDGRAVRAWVARDGDRRFIKAGPNPAVTLTRSTGAGERPAAGRSPRGPARLEAAMHGRVTVVATRVGARVGKGETLVVLEAMKMEIRVTAPFDGTIAAIDCRVGEIIERGRVLATVTPLAVA